MYRHKSKIELKLNVNIWICEAIAFCSFHLYSTTNGKGKQYTHSLIQLNYGHTILAFIFTYHTGAYESWYKE